MNNFFFMHINAEVINFYLIISLFFFFYDCFRQIEKELYQLLFLFLLLHRV